VCRVILFYKITQWYSVSILDSVIMVMAAALTTKADGGVSSVKLWRKLVLARWTWDYRHNLDYLDSP
jgi:hypothetical protein